MAYIAIIAAYVAFEVFARSDGVGDGVMLSVLGDVENYENHFHATTSPHYWRLSFGGLALSILQDGKKKNVANMGGGFRLTLHK